MPLRDFKCANDECDAVVLDRFMNPGRLVPEHCGQPMVQLPSAPAFHVKGFAAKNGYSGGQTYEVKVKEKDMRVVVKS